MTLCNLGMLTGVARAHAAEHSQSSEAALRDAAGKILDDARTLYGIDFLSPGGGEYTLADDGRTMQHTLYGSQLQPRQPERPAPDSDTAQALGGLGGVTVSLTFLEDGLHAVLQIDRRPTGPAA